MDSRVRTLLVVGVLLTPLGVTAQVPEPPIELQVRISETMGALADALTAETSQRREAEESILKLHTSLLEPVRVRAADADPEVRLRARDTLSDALLQTRILRVLAHVPPENEFKLRRFRKAHPDLFDDVFGEDLERRTAAVARIATLDDPDALAEPLLVMCLGHPSEQMQTAAVYVATTGRYRGDATIRKLMDIVERRGLRRQHGYGRHDSTPLPGDLALTAVTEIGSPAAAPGLTKLITQCHQHFGYSAEIELAEALAATGELRVIPHLIGRLDLTHHTISMELEHGHFSKAPCDAPLLALLFITGQDPSRYGFVLAEHYSDRMFGFTDAHDRENAVKRFRKWWDEHKDDPPYADMEPLELNRRSRRTDRQRTTTPASTTATATMPTSQPVSEAEIAQLARSLEDLAADAGRQWRDESYRNRRRAGPELLTTLEMMTEPLVARARDPRARQAALSVLSRLVVQADGQKLLADLAARGLDDQLEKALEFRRRRGGLFEDLLSLNWYRRAEALGKVRRISDTEGLAEPLLIHNLSHSSRQVVRAALQACGSGSYDSDAMVDEMLGIVSENTDESSSHWWHEQNRPLAIAAMRVLRKIGSSRAAPSLMSLLRRYIDQRNYQWAAEATHALAACGTSDLLPSLMKNFGDTSTRTTHGTSSSDGEEFELTIADSDFYLMTAVVLSDQEPSDYGFITLPHHGSDQEPLFGFADEQKREEAIEKFEQWRRERHGEPPGDDVEASDDDIEPPATTRQAPPEGF
ncbi:MAG: hypothetical protein ACOC9S_04735 [Planctomycetota bacterium]